MSLFNYDTKGAPKDDQIKLSSKCVRRRGPFPARSFFRVGSSAGLRQQLCYKWMNDLISISDHKWSCIIYPKVVKRTVRYSNQVPAMSYVVTVTRNLVGEQGAKDKWRDFIYGK